MYLYVIFSIVQKDPNGSRQTYLCHEFLRSCATASSVILESIFPAYSAVDTSLWMIERVASMRCLSRCSCAWVSLVDGHVELAFWCLYAGFRVFSIYMRAFRSVYRIAAF